MFFTVLLFIFLIAMVIGLIRGVLEVVLQRCSDIGVWLGLDAGPLTTSLGFICLLVMCAAVLFVLALCLSSLIDLYRYVAEKIEDMFLTTELGGGVYTIAVAVSWFTLVAGLLWLKG